MNYAKSKGSQITSSKKYKLGSTATSIISLEKRLKERKKSRMTIRQRIRNWLYADSNDMPEAVVREDDSDLHLDNEQTMHFAVVPANGGRIVQVRYYDRQKDRHYTKLHLITPDENLAESLAHILQLETLSR